MRIAQCGCGAVQAACEGEPVRVSVCHCLNCKRRSGSAFAVQARWPEDRVTLSGETREWRLTGDEGGVATFHFCPTCGATAYYTVDGMPGFVAVPLGAFADPDFTPYPFVSVYENRMCPWLEIKGDIQRC